MSIAAHTSAGDLLASGCRLVPPRWFWLHRIGPAVMLEGADAGVSSWTVHDPARRVTHTVMSNTTSGAWPIARRLDELLIV